MKFNSEKFSSQEEIPQEKGPGEELIKQTGQELTVQLERKKGFFEKLGRSDIVKIIAFLTTFFSGVETTFAQSPDLYYEKNIESAKKSVIELTSAIKEKPDRTGIETSGKKSNFFQKNFPGKKIYANDRYIYIKEEALNGHTLFCVDKGFDGVVDEVVIVPGKLSEGAEGEVEEANIVGTFDLSVDDVFQQNRLEGPMALRRKELGIDNPYTHRVTSIISHPGEEYQAWYRLYPTKPDIVELVGQGKHETMDQGLGEMMIHDALSDIKAETGKEIIPDINVDPGGEM